VQRLLKLIRFRNEYDAFNGDFQVVDGPKNEIRLSWKKGNAQCSLFIDLLSNKTSITYLDDNGKEIEYLV